MLFRIKSIILLSIRRHCKYLYDF